MLANGLDNRGRQCTKLVTSYTDVQWLYSMSSYSATTTVFVWGKTLALCEC